MIRITFVPAGIEFSAKQKTFSADGVLSDDGWVQLKQTDGKVVAMIPIEQVRLVEFIYDN